ESGEDIRDGAGPDDMTRDVALLGAEDAHDVDILRVDGVDAGGGGEEDEKEYDRGDERDFRLEIDAEPEDEERRQGELRHAIAAGEIGIEDRAGHRMAAQREEQERARNAAQKRAVERRAQRVACLEDEIAALHLVDEAGEDEPRAREPDRAEIDAAALPERDDDDDGDGAVDQDAPPFRVEPAPPRPAQCAVPSNVRGAR